MVEATLLAASICGYVEERVKISSPEYDANNVRNVNNDGNCNNANKNNEYFVVPCREIVMAEPLILKDWYTYKDIVRAYLDCRKRKRATRSAVSYEVDFERYLWNLLQTINDRTYKIGGTNVFAISVPKHREIWASQFQDRIVHHLIYNDIGHWYESKFIEDSFSCIKGRGTLAASQRLESFCRKASRSWTEPVWFLKVDIRNFFCSIDRNILWQIVEKSVGTESLTSHLLKQIINHDPTTHPIVKKGSDFTKIPKHKSLWHCAKNKGLPIGNLTSQFLSNVYLDAWDKYIKHTLKVKWYVRYVDDAVLLSRNRKQLYEWLQLINRWLITNRGVSLHENKSVIGPITQGINFVGRIVLPYRTYPRRSVVTSARKSADKLRKNPLDRAAYDQVQSYLGLMRHANSFNLRRKMCDYVSLAAVIGHDSESTKLLRLMKEKS